MSPRLSPKTLEHIDSLFQPGSREEVVELLMHQCGNNLPFCEKSDEFQLERVRFAALKLSRGNLEKLREAIKRVWARCECSQKLVTYPELGPSTNLTGFACGHNFRVARYVHLLAALNDKGVRLRDELSRNRSQRLWHRQHRRRKFWRNNHFRADRRGRSRAHIAFR